MKTLYIMGCGGHARSIADSYIQLHHETKILFIDANARDGEQVLGFDLQPEIDAKQLAEGFVFIGIGDNTQRSITFEKHQFANLISIISSSAYLSPSATIGRGCFVGNFCHIGPEAAVGDNTIINTGSMIEHGVKVGKHSHIAPNVAISGNTIIGDHVFVGVGSSIIDKVSICDHVTVGAGSTVTKDIRIPGTYVGTPIRKIK